MDKDILENFWGKLNTEEKIEFLNKRHIHHIDQHNEKGGELSGLILVFGSVVVSVLLTLTVCGKL